MECREERLTWEAALVVYNQLCAVEEKNLLEDGLPTTIEGLPDTEPLRVDDRAARAFLRQFRGDPMRSFFTLQLDACTPERFQQMTARWADSPTTQRFFTMLAQIDNATPRTPAEYLAAEEFNATALDQLQRLATVVERLDPTVADDDLAYFCNAVRHAITLGALADCTTALETLTRTPFRITVSGPNNSMRELGGTVRDLACQILSLVALADLEVELCKHFSAGQQRLLPAPIVQLRHIKATVIAGKIRSHYDPLEIATRIDAAARYDMVTNTIEYGTHCDAATFLSRRLNNTGIRYPAQVALHELTHAAQDTHKGIFAPDQPIMCWHHDEAVATFTEMFYVRLKDGPGIKADFAPPYDRGVRADAQLTSIVQQYLGVALPADLPNTDYRGLTVQRVEAYITQMRAGRMITGVDLRDVAERHANSEATRDLLLLLANVRPWKILAERAKANEPFDQPTLLAKLSPDHSAILYYKASRHLPTGLHQWSAIVEENIRLMEDYYTRMKNVQSPELYANIEYAFWSSGFPTLVQSMMEYALYRHISDTTFDVKQFITERLFPMTLLRYMMPRNPADLGVDTTNK